MKKYLLLVVFTITVAQAFAQGNNVWQTISSDRANLSERIRETPYSLNQRFTTFNSDEFRQFLTNISDVNSEQAGVEIEFPNSNGVLEKYLVWESSNFEPGLQAKYSEIRAFVGKGITDSSAKINFSFSPYGIQTMVFRADKGTEFIEPYTKDNSVYVIFDSATRIKGRLPFNCSTADVALNQDLLNDKSVTAKSSAQVFKTLRLALSCTGEYGKYFGGTDANKAPVLAAMNATMTRVNAVMQNDLALKLLIIDGDDAVVYTSGTTDPYSPVVGGSAPDAWNQEVSDNLYSVIGASNFDIGHLFGATGGGGNSGCIGCVCVDTFDGNAPYGKAGGYTSPSGGIPQGDNFDIDYVAHEMGHQLGAHHTFSYGGVNGTENTQVNVEPGSGTTIMGYAGITGSTDVQPHSDPYYAYRSISEIQTNLAQPTKTCPITYNANTTPAYTNTKPTVVAGGNFTIPTNTPFKLTGTGTGTVGEVLTYCWEQDNDATVTGPSDSFPSPTKTNGANFRSRIPSLSPTRYFPQFSDVLSGILTTTWETVSSVARTMKFELTVRDNVLNGGQTNSAGNTITVVDTGSAFAITSPAIEDTTFDLGSNQTITWNVAGTTANGINTANVKISLSTDGGQTFSTLIESTPNDGSEIVTLSNTPSPFCRIMVEAVGNVFYSVSTNFGIGSYTYTTTCNTYSNNTIISVPDGTGVNVPGDIVSKTISVPDSGIITSIMPTVSGAHSRYGNLVVTLIHPDGTQSRLMNKTCNNATSGFNIPFNDDYPALSCNLTSSNTSMFKPNDPLAVFNSKNMNGTWTLTAQDYYAGNTGTIKNWAMEICAMTPVLATQDNQIVDLSVSPNPNKGIFTIQFNNPSADEVKVAVYDISGRRIFQNSFVGQSIFNENIQMNNAESGVYLVSVTDGGRKSIKKIVVE